MGINLLLSEEKEQVSSWKVHHISSYRVFYTTDVVFHISWSQRDEKIASRNDVTLLLRRPVIGGVRTIVLERTTVQRRIKVASYKSALSPKGLLLGCKQHLQQAMAILQNRSHHFDILNAIRHKHDGMTRLPILPDEGICLGVM